MTLYLIRHGKTDWNVNGLLQGKSDIPLNAEGIEAAEKLKKEFLDKNVDICFSSPLKRAYDTARIIFPSLDITVDNNIVERGLGIFEGKHFKVYTSSEYWDYKKNNNAGGVEPVRNLLERSEKFLNMLKENYMDKTVAVVSHGAFLKALHYVITGYDENTNFKSLSLDNCGVLKYEIGGEI